MQGVLKVVSLRLPASWVSAVPLDQLLILSPEHVAVKYLKHGNVIVSNTFMPYLSQVF